jgi:hypothetical protein
MSRAADVETLIMNFADALDGTLDSADGDIFERIAIMTARDSLRRYGGLWDVPRCRKVIEWLPQELERCGYPDELLLSVRKSCSRVVAALRKA